MVVYNVRVAVIGQSTNNNKNEIGLIQMPKWYYTFFMVILFRWSAVNLSDQRERLFEFVNELFGMKACPIVRFYLSRLLGINKNIGIEKTLIVHGARHD